MSEPMKTLREGEHITAPTDIPTASAHESHARHTPGPWRVFDESFPNHHFPGIEAPDYSVVVWGRDDERCGVQGRTTEEARANAAFIVRACNHHEALLAACKLALDDAGELNGVTRRGRIREAIANAEGK